MTIGQSVTEIGNSAFYNCSGLIGELTIPNSVTTISYNAFNGCTGLANLTIGQSVTNIDNLAFYGCTGLTGELTIPNSVTNIGSSAFQGCTGIETLNYNAINCADFGSSSYQPFYNLNITSINIGDNVHRIPAYFAYGLSKLSSVTMPSSVTSVGTQAFYNCPIIESVTCLATTPPSTSTNGIDMFNTNVYIHSPLYVPMGTEKSYMYDQSWGQFINVIGIKVQDDVLATEITLDQSVMSMILGTTSQLVATVMPDSTTNKAVSWASSNPSVATVDENGLVTAMGLGSATITAVTCDGSNLSASCRVIVTSLSATNMFVINDAEVQHGQSITIPIAMNNEETIMAFQTDIYLPKGFNIVTNQVMEPIVTPGPRLTEDHQLVAEQLNWAVRVLCYTPDMRPIVGNEGDLFYITVMVPENAEGNYTIYLRDSRLTTANYEELRIPDAGAVITVKDYIPGDANDSHTVTVTDIVVTAQYILQRNPSPFIFAAADMNDDGSITVTDIMLIARLILYPEEMNAPRHAPVITTNNDCMSGEDIALMAGETRRVSILLDNEMDYSAFQLDLALPDGLTASNFALTDRAGRHAFDVSTIDGGKLRALCYSPAIEAIEGHSGALLTFDVTATAAIEGNITVDGIELVTTDCQTVLLDGFTIGVNNVTSVNELSGGKTVARIDYYNLAGQRIDRPESGVTLVVTTYTDGTRTTAKVIQ